MFRSLMKASKSSWNGHVIADICVIPVVTDSVSLSKEIAKVEKILARFPLERKLHAYGTNLEGKWDDVSEAIKAIHTELHDSGIVRISCNMRWGSRIDKAQTLQDKVDSVEALL